MVNFTELSGVSATLFREDLRTVDPPATRRTRDVVFTVDFTSDRYSSTSAHCALTSSFFSLF